MTTLYIEVSQECSSPVPSSYGMSQSFRRVPYSPIQSASSPQPSLIPRLSLLAHYTCIFVLSSKVMHTLLCVRRESLGTRLPTTHHFKSCPIQPMDMLSSHCAKLHMCIMPRAKVWATGLYVYLCIVSSLVPRPFERGRRLKGLGTRLGRCVTI